MKFKLIQVDTRPLLIPLKSKKLIYAPENEINDRILHAINNNTMTNIQDPVTMCAMLNSVKMKMCGFSYEFINYDKENLPFSLNERCLFWIKIKALIDQINPSSPPLLAFIDSDAWVRDELKFIAFIEEFEKSSYSIGCAKDVQQNLSCMLNSGFIICKNNEKTKKILEDIYTNPKYSQYWLENFHEQSALSIYQQEHPDDIQVLSMTDFNTPCGNIVRHCWIKHWLPNSLLDEIYTSFIKVSLMNESDSIKLGNKRVFYDE